ncbi:hypothetical protein [Oscillibacter sp.]|uniref:hypothetical protein n=1 Tax=Oscillibacter sp. TaxID=1945593 RepID=UPI001B3F9752|nr:hypothetical protein [Oscillibacter sp.]MBP3508634.1 hypothetical protein [Oscillibacter sp.]
MTRPNTDRQASRRKSALWSAVSNTVIQLVSAAAVLWCRGVVDSAALSVVLLVIALVNLGTIVPVWISFRIRLKEIEGGEEDAAAEY